MASGGVTPMLETERLILRNWREEDRDRVRDISRQGGVQAGLGQVDDIEARIARVTANRPLARPDGYRFLALERRSDARVIGWCGLKRGDVAAIAGQLEIGWTVADECVGQGFAREAAETVLARAAENFPGEIVWAITAKTNARSWGLMHRLGMVHSPEMEFDHPLVPVGSPLHRHVVYSKEFPQ